ncbi:MAG: SGNH/GDSL hydrolase family protein [Propionibacteriaceae bacterium]|nr:SGNH/GDSL hydrolase family protein [Propionibacteriaceae bacterium]
MKTIVIFGDSLTWGYDPANELLPPGGKLHRFSDSQRWPGVLAAELGDDYQVIVEGLCGRTTVWDDPTEPWRCGTEQLIPVLDSHAPFDLVIILLGTNDLKGYFSARARDIARGAGILVDQALHHCVDDFTGPAKVLLVAPPVLGERIDETASDFAFTGALAKSKDFATQYHMIADKWGAYFFDAASVTTTSQIDQVHLDVEQHARLGRALAPLVAEILNN